MTHGQRVIAPKRLPVVIPVSATPEVIWAEWFLPIPYQLWDDGTLTHGVDQKVLVRVIVELERLDDPAADPIVWSKTYRPRTTQDRSQSPVRLIEPSGEIFPLPQ